MTPTQRSLAHLRAQGYAAYVVEHWDHWSKRRKDFLGFADIIALRAGEPPLAVQTTTGSNLAARRAKIAESEAAAQWLSTGAGIAIHGWRKLKVKRGGKAMRWAVREERVDA